MTKLVIAEFADEFDFVIESLRNDGNVGESAIRDLEDVRGLN